MVRCGGSVNCYMKWGEEREGEGIFYIYCHSLYITQQIFFLTLERRFVLTSVPFSTSKYSTDVHVCKLDHAISISSCLSPCTFLAFCYVWMNHPISTLSWRTSVALSSSAGLLSVCVRQADVVCSEKPSPRTTSPCKFLWQMVCGHYEAFKHLMHKMTFPLPSTHVR